MAVDVSSARLGVVSDNGLEEARETMTAAPAATATTENQGDIRGENRITAPDFFIRKDGLEYAGTHLLVELWDASALDSIPAVEAALREAVEACGATLLNVFLHHFGEGCGVSGVAVLAESHISIHTWPERGDAAVDIFMCGGCEPYAAIAVLKRHFEPGSVQVTEAKRGLVP